MRKGIAAGFYFVALAGIIGIFSIVRFLMWAPAHNSMDYVILVALVAGVAADVVLLIKDWDLLTVFATACYSIGAVKMLTDSVGSFVDAFQGINMFGDATQVGTIIQIAAVMLVSVLLSIIAAFMKRWKEA